VTRAFSGFVEHFLRAFKAQAHYAQDHPQATHALQALQDLTLGLLEEHRSLEVVPGEDTLFFNGRALEGAPNAAQTLAQTLHSHGIAALTFLPDLGPEDLRLLLYLLHLRPGKVAEMGGPQAALSEAAGLRVRELPAGRVAPEAPLAEIPASPRALGDDLSSLLGAVIQMTAAPIRPNPRAPWTMEQREALTTYGFLIADLGALAGTGDQLGLSTVEPGLLRAALRTALDSLDPFLQGALLLGLPEFPSTEMALRRGLDYLAPEIMAQAVAEAYRQRPASRFDLALAAAAMLQCVKDRELGIESLKGRLVLEGWTLAEADSLEEGIRWECHGTDTKLQLALMDRTFFELDANQLAILVRQLARAKRVDGLRDLLAQLETGFSSPHVARRRMAAEVLADLAECLADPGLPAETEQRLLSVTHRHIITEVDPQATQWSCQAMETLLAQWMRHLNFSAIYAQMLALGEMALPHAEAPPWKVQAIKDLLARLASPPNLGFLVPLLHQREAQLSLPQLHALLTLLGRPAAQFLVNRLETEEEGSRRSHLMGALRAIGRNAVPALVEALTSSHWYLIRNALLLLGDIGHPPAYPHVALALGHRDTRVRKAALQATIQLGPAERALETLVKALETSEPATQLDILAALGEIGGPGAGPALLRLVAGTQGADGEVAKVRLRAVEILGRTQAPDALPLLASLFQRRSLLGAREGTAIRLAAVQALRDLGTREARETLARVLDQESDDDVRTAIRAALVG
jgi:HEAT repeat protein